jgi:hypothetical protein
VVPEVGIAPTSPRLQRGANLPQLLGDMVVLAGNAPASSGYQPGALLLSYGTMAEGVGNAPTSARADPVFGTGAASLYLPAFQELAARVGLAPTPSGLTGRRATLTPPGKGAAGRISTCIVPLRRRRPDVFDHGSVVNWSARQEWASRALRDGCPKLRCSLSRTVMHLRSLGPKPSALAATLRAEKRRTRRDLHP